ncbi:transposase [Rhodohalobacter mucosus]|uniref:transposase n=1 Tax=Rhodohalobacter mucosus TaxID=2079485 RepID=UPI001304835E|nr:transposase [Rhodohalobacter mucosus]
MEKDFCKDVDYQLRKRRIDELFFKKYESLLDSQSTGPHWLKKKSIAAIVMEALHFRDRKEYDLYAYCIMSNHVHIVFKDLSPYQLNPIPEKEKEKAFPVTKIMHSLKSYTALMANRKLNRTGAFWHEESYDRMIRSETELENTIRYTLNNPVKINLVTDWWDWPYNYCKPEFSESF